MSIQSRFADPTVFLRSKFSHQIIERRLGKARRPNSPQSHLPPKYQSFPPLTSHDEFTPQTFQHVQLAFISPWEAGRTAQVSLLFPLCAQLLRTHPAKWRPWGHRLYRGPGRSAAAVLPTRGTALEVVFTVKETLRVNLHHIFAYHGFWTDISHFGGAAPWMPLCAKSLPLPRPVPPFLLRKQVALK